LNYPEDSDEQFAYIAGYTPGGAPFGVTWEEWEELQREEQWLASSLTSDQNASAATMDAGGEIPF